MAPREPKFDIFSGQIDKDAIWVTAVEGLAKARERMEEIAAKKPGAYFLFYAMDRSILAKIDTSAAPRIELQDNVA